MLNFVHGELWRAFRKVGNVALLGLLFLLPFIGNAFLAFLNFSWWEYYGQEGRIRLGDVLLFFRIQIPFWGCLLTFFTSGMVFGDEFRLRTIKNSVAAGMGRGVVYLGKFLAELTYSFLSFIVAAGSLLVSGMLFLPWNWTELSGILEDYFRLMIACIPLWVGVLGFLHFMLFTVQNGVAIAGLSMVAAFSILLFLASLPFSQAMDFYLPVWLMHLSDYTADRVALDRNFLAGCWRTGILYAGVFSLAGYLTFCRRELK